MRRQLRWLRELQSEHDVPIAAFFYANSDKAKISTISQK
jgi:hypothetical protein